MAKIRQTEEHGLMLKKRLENTKQKSMSTTHLYRMENNVSRNCIGK